LAFEWILPLFPAQPKLGPVYQPITHLVPLHFPLLLIVPAIALDLLWSKTGDWGRWRQALVTGPVFVLTFFGGAMAPDRFHENGNERLPGKSQGPRLDRGRLWANHAPGDESGDRDCGASTAGQRRLGGLRSGEI
jgi:hypothetical protein